MLEVKVKKLREDVIIPQQADTGSVGFDLSIYLPFDNEAGEQVSKVVLNPNQSVLLSTELAFEIPEGYYMQIHPRSSMGIKKKLILENLTAIIDSSYRGPVMLAIKNIGQDKVEILHRERLAQAIILPYPKVKFIEAEELSETERGEGGFGSSGRV